MFTKMASRNKCPICLKNIDKNRLHPFPMSHHINICKALKSFSSEDYKSCKICDFTPIKPSKQNILQHLRAKHPFTFPSQEMKQKEQCSFCYIKGHKLNIAKHMNICKIFFKHLHASEDGFQCIYCKSKRSRRQQMIEHLKKKHMEKINCCYCNQVLNNQDMHEHVEACEEASQSVNGLQCKICTVKFESKLEAFNHVKKVHQSFEVTQVNVVKIKILDLSKIKKEEEEKCAFCEQKVHISVMNKHLQLCSIASRCIQGLRCKVCNAQFESKKDVFQHVKDIDVFCVP